MIFIKITSLYKTFFNRYLFSLVILSSSGNFYSCDEKPPMVRTFEHNLNNEDALREAQLVFESLGYKISTFDEIDNSFTTQLRVINRLFRPIYYTIFVSAQDRLTIVVYSEVRTFKRASGADIGSNNNQIMQDASNNLGDKFQAVIFNPIIKAIESKGFAKWDRKEDSILDDLLIESSREANLWLENEKYNKIKKRYESQRINDIKILEMEQDYLRLRAILEAENNIDFWGNSDTGRSLVGISKIINSYKDNFDQIFKNSLNSIRHYYGNCHIQLIIRPDGTIEDIDILINSSSRTPDIELRDALKSTLKAINFMKGENYIRLEQLIDFRGSYNNLKVKYSNLKLTGLFTENPISDKDVFADTLFKIKKYNKQVIQLKN
ncbi:MAG: hypothetical protein CMG75_01595 [Candidatus Marinimicrobia bacterium]|nr:hypothetical protein [Candidatus Neomarinimicrobiota bacterium]